MPKRTSSESDGLGKVGRDSTRRIGLYLFAADSFSRGVLRGVLDYVQAHGGWGVSIFTLHREGPSAMLKTWEGDAIIAQVASKGIHESLQKKGLPTVNVSTSLMIDDYPRVIVDDRAVGRMAAERFLAQGFRKLAFVPFEGKGFSAMREQGFAAAARAAGASVVVYDSSHDLVSDEGTSLMADWLRELPKPVGIFAANDARGRHLISVAQKAGLSVPEQIAVIGVDDDELICGLSLVPLSSVAVNTYEVGWQAMKMAEAIASGQSPAEPVLVPPVKVVVRRSSDVLAIEDPYVAKAVRFIWDHFADFISVEDILDGIPNISRRRLEQRFLKVLGHSPMQEVRRARIEKAKTLLSQTDLAMPKIAMRCGFADYKVLSMSFRGLMNMTPTTYRGLYRRR